MLSNEDLGIDRGSFDSRFRDVQAFWAGGCDVVFPLQVGPNLHPGRTNCVASAGLGLQSPSVSLNREFRRAKAFLH